MDVCGGQARGKRARDEAAGRIAANRHELLDAGRSGRLAALLVQRTARWSELEHLAEHGHAAAGGRCRQSEEHRSHGGRARVVRVVHEPGATREHADRAAAGNRHERRNPRLDRRSRHVELNRHRHSREHVHELRPACQRHL